MTPLEYAEQPADVILLWYRYLRFEGEQQRERDQLAEMRGRQH